MPLLCAAAHCNTLQHVGKDSWLRATTVCVATQVNNQPPLMGQVALACDVITDVITGGGDELQALAAATTYFASNGSAGWCYDFNATLFMTGGLVAGYLRPQLCAFDMSSHMCASCVA